MKIEDHCNLPAGHARARLHIKNLSPVACLDALLARTKVINAALCQAATLCLSAPLAEVSLIGHFSDGEGCAP